MNAKLRFSLAVLVLFLLMTGPFMLAALFIWLEASDIERETLQHLMGPRLPLGTMLTAFGFALGVLVIRHLFRDYLGGLLRMAEHLRLLLDANRHFKIQTDGPPEVKSLAEAANALAQQRNELVDTIQAQIAEANERVEEEKNRLAALISELSQSVVVCNRDGRVLLYNQQARLQFRSMASHGTGFGSSGSLGLGRSIFTMLDRQQLAHAQEILEHRVKVNSQSAQASFVTTTGKGQLLRVQLVPVLSGERTQPETLQINGYVLTIENITQHFDQETQRDRAFSDLVGQLRSELIPVRTALQTLLQDSRLSPDVVAEVRHIEEGTHEFSKTLDASMIDFASMLKFRWPLDEILVSDVITAAQRKIEQQLNLATDFHPPADQWWIRADSYHLVFALEFLAEQLQTACDVRSIVFRQEACDERVCLDLVWQAQMVSSETVATWELDAMSVAGFQSPLSLREVLQRHGAEFRYERNKVRHEGYFRFVFPRVTPELSLDRPSIERPEYYDFDLFHARDNGDLLDRSLKDITYTVFDTETTGLEPSKGDEIIQFGAIRVVNGRLLAQETFDQLVYPGFPLPPAGIPIHGIRDEMLRDQPRIDVVLPAFHDFVADTALVAHNAAFDMRFLQLKEDSLGIRFGQPVLDTLLLSAVVHPNQTSHALDAIAERLGIQVTKRHNALADAWVTGEVFVRLIPLLADMGIVTLRQALAAAEKTYFARIKY